MELLERDREREALETAIEESRSAGRVVILAGEAGIGKTALVTALADGHRGAMIKSIGTAARRELERELGMRVHLDLSVRVRRSWRGDDALLDRLGIT